MLIGIDPHKSTHTATALDPATNSDQGSIRIDDSHAGYRQLLVWARQWPERTWAVQNAEGLGHHLAQWLVTAGEAVVDVAPAATARVRQLSAVAVARTTASMPRRPPVLRLYRVMPVRSSPKRAPTPSLCSMSDASVNPLEPWRVQGIDISAPTEAARTPPLIAASHSWRAFRQERVFGNPFILRVASSLVTEHVSRTPGGARRARPRQHEQAGDQRQHDALDPICVRAFEEKVSGKLTVSDRLGMQAPRTTCAPAIS